MARLQRVTSKVFAENATEVGQFGSLNAGTKLTTTDISTIQALPAWQNGWQAATVGENCYPTLQERNGLDKVQSYFLNYLLQEGIPEWDSGTTYYTGGIVKVINGADVRLYQSLVDNNTAALSDTNSWKEWNYANLDLTNVNQTGKNNIMAWGMPDYKNGVQVSLTVNTWRTVTNDCYVMYYARHPNGSSLYLKDENGVSIPSPTAGLINGFSLVGAIENGVFVPKGYSYLSDTATLFVEYPLKGAN